MDSLEPFESPDFTGSYTSTGVTGASTVVLYSGGMTGGSGGGGTTAGWMETSVIVTLSNCRDCVCI